METNSQVTKKMVFAHATRGYTQQIVCHLGYQKNMWTLNFVKLIVYEIAYKDAIIMKYPVYAKLLFLKKFY